MQKMKFKKPNYLKGYLKIAIEIDVEKVKKNLVAAIR